MEAKRFRTFCLTQVISDLAKLLFGLAQDFCLITCSDQIRFFSYISVTANTEEFGENVWKEGRGGFTFTV